MKKTVYTIYVRSINRNREDWYKLVWFEDEDRTKRMLNDLGAFAQYQEFKIEKEELEIREKNNE